MNWFEELQRRLSALFHGKRMEDDLAEEMRLHLELRAAEKAEQGAAPPDARAEARRQFGNLTQHHEAGREAWGWAWFDSLAQDIRYGIRNLSANPGFTLTAVLSLALGIGANTAIFTIVNAVMLRSLPVEDPQRLVQISSGPKIDSFTNPLWEQIRDHQQGFSGTLAYSGDRFDLAEGGDRQFANGIWVSGDFFKVLGVAPLLGRVFTTDEDRHGGGKAGPVAIISYSFWKSHYGGEAVSPGQDHQARPPPIRNRRRDSALVHGPGCGLGFRRGNPYRIRTGTPHRPERARPPELVVVADSGRLAPDTTMQQVEAQMKAQAPAIFRATLPPDYEPQDKQEYLRRTLTVRPAATGFSQTGAQYRNALFTLMAVVGLVLLIACANIANLLLARAAARQREISIRLAIGAGRRRVIRQLLTESLLISLLGAAGALLLARWGSALLIRLLSNSRSPLELDLSLDFRVLAFTVAVAILTGVLFGLAPAFRATGTNPNQFLKEHSQGANPSRFRLGRMLVAGQVALSLVLLVGAGLFLGTMRNLLTTPAGFDPRNILLVQSDSVVGVPKPQRNDLHRTILERLRTLPGVTSAACSALTPVSNMMWDQFAYPEGYQAKSRDDTDTYMNRVSPDYFRTLRTPIVLGRDFNDRDTLQSPKVMIINETAARQFFANTSPLGKIIALDVKPGVKDNYEVVGVVKDAKYENLRQAAPRTGYLPAAQDPDPWGQMNFEVRSAGSVEDLIPSIRSAIKDINPGVSLEFRKFETQVNESLLQERTVALLSAFLRSAGPVTGDDRPLRSHRVFGGCGGSPRSGFAWPSGRSAGR